MHILTNNRGIMNGSRRKSKMAAWWSVSRNFFENTIMEFYFTLIYILCQDMLKFLSVLIMIQCQYNNLIKLFGVKLLTIALERKVFFIGQEIKTRDVITSEIITSLLLDCIF